MTGVEVPVLIHQILSVYELWVCLCKSLRVISSWFLQIVWKEFLFIFVWRIYLVQSLEQIIFLVCASFVWCGSPSCYSVFLIETDLHSHLPLKQAGLWVRPLQEAQHMAVLCCTLNALIVTHRSCGRKVTLYSMARHILCPLNTAVVFHRSGSPDNRSCLALMCRILKNQYNSNNRGLLPSCLLFPGHTEQQWLCH